MFDPTVFENLKVVAEGAMYDRDLEGEILITNRKDVVDLATMSRTYSASFIIREVPHISACFTLIADCRNLANEILEVPSFLPGCSLELTFFLSISTPEKDCPRVENVMHSIWGKERMITQTISYEYNKQAVSYDNTVTVSFQKAITVSLSK